MTKLSIALATASLTLALAPAAQAYSVEPTYTVRTVALTVPGDVPPAGVCVPKITPELAAALALPKASTDRTTTQIACADD